MSMKSKPCVYMIGYADRDRPIKVGLTGDCPHRRLKILQIGNSEVLLLRDFIEVPVALLAHAEHRSHQTLWDFRVHGEWFNVDLDTARAAILEAVAFLEKNPPPRKPPRIIPEDLLGKGRPKKMTVRQKAAAKKKEVASRSATVLVFKDAPKAGVMRVPRPARPPPVKRTEWLPNLRIGPDGHFATSWDEIHAWRAAGRPSPYKKGNDNDET